MKMTCHKTLFGVGRKFAKGEQWEEGEPIKLLPGLASGDLGFFCVHDW